MEIRQVGLKDLSQVKEILSDAIALLGKTSLQWQQGYPNEATMKEDIEARRLYGVYEGQSLLGIAALIKGKNPDYQIIKGGSWIVPAQNEDLVIHRIAVREGYHGKRIGQALMEHAEKIALEQGCSSIKIDTHARNLPMQALCKKNGYSYRGIITLLRKEEDPDRLAFEKVL